MRFHFDERKSGRLRVNPKRGIGFEEAQEVFSHPYYLDQRTDWPEQYRAIGWVGGAVVYRHFRSERGRRRRVLPPRHSLEGHQAGAATLWRTLVKVGNQCRQKSSPALRTKGGMCHGSSPLPGA